MNPTTPLFVAMQRARAKAQQAATQTQQSAGRMQSVMLGHAKRAARAANVAGQNKALRTTTKLGLAGAAAAYGADRMTADAREFRAEYAASILAGAQPDVRQADSAAYMYLRAMEKAANRYRVLYRVVQATPTAYDVALDPLVRTALEYQRDAILRSVAEIPQGHTPFRADIQLRLDNAVASMRTELEHLSTLPSAIADAAADSILERDLSYNVSATDVERQVNADMLELATDTGTVSAALRDTVWQDVPARDIASWDQVKARIRDLAFPRIRVVPGEETREAATKSLTDIQQIELARTPAPDLPQPNSTAKTASKATMR